MEKRKEEKIVERRKEIKVNTEENNTGQQITISVTWLMGGDKVKGCVTSRGEKIIL